VAQNPPFYFCRCQKTDNCLKLFLGITLTYAVRMIVQLGHKISRLNAVKQC
jgi:hypothetical protein